MKKLKKNQQSLVSDALSDCYLWNNCIDEAFSNQLSKEILSLPLKREVIKMFGREIMVPRQTLWMANPGITYRYSGLSHHPYPWTPEMKMLHDMIAESICEFNSVLINLYTNGDYYMGYHQDNEPEVDLSAGIFSLSLGQSRDFLFKSITDKKKIVKIKLCDRDGLYMGPQTLIDWQHALPKRKNVNNLRINLTFRRICPI